MSDTLCHSRTNTSFLEAHPDMMNSDISKNLYVLRKKVSDNPKQGSRVLHFITHYISHDKHTTKRGFDVTNIGNTYFREHIQNRHAQQRQQQQQIPARSTPYENYTAAAEDEDDYNMNDDNDNEWQMTDEPNDRNITQSSLSNKRQHHYESDYNSSSESDYNVMTRERR